MCGSIHSSRPPVKREVWKNPQFHQGFPLEGIGQAIDYVNLLYWRPDGISKDPKDHKDLKDPKARSVMSFMSLESFRSFEAGKDARPPLRFSRIPIPGISYSSGDSSRLTFSIMSCTTPRTRI